MKSYTDLLQEAERGMSIVRFIRWTEELDLAGATLEGQVALPDGSGHTGHRFTLRPEQRQVYVRRDSGAVYRLWQPAGTEQA